MSHLTMTSTEEKQTHTSSAYCFIDAQRRNKENKNLYSEMQHSKADELFERVTNAYWSSTVYRNYRATFIAVKVDKPVISDLVSNRVSELDQFCNDNNIVKAQSGKNIIYRIALK
jgi:hypothetical protein